MNKIYNANNGKKYKIGYDEPSKLYYVQEESIQGEVQFLHTDINKCINYINKL
jgi:hypothetical protein